MKLFDVTIEETLCQTFKIYASSPEEAFRVAEKKYKTEELIVEFGEVQDVKFLLGNSANA